MSTIRIFPVGNGDQSLITVSEDNYNTNIIVDCSIRKDCLGEDDPAMCDVKAGLVNELNKKEVYGIKDVSYTDIFILTHGDDDHLRGFEQHFYQGDPRNFKQKHKDAGEIFIDVLWFSPMVMGECTSSDEECFNAEAKRRINLHRSNSPEKDLPGNKIVIIGYDENENLENLGLVRKVPGDIITRFNDRDLKTFSIFIHAPFKQQLASSDPGKNHTSIVFQARFRESAWSTKFSVLALFGGDADYIAWDIILQKTIGSGKDVSENALEWDLLIAPHHCSWSFFNEHDNKKEVQQSSLEILKYKRPGGIVISSSKKIEDNEDNPPSYLAKQEYIKMLDKKEHFLNTAIEPDENAPEPIVFIITANGPVRPPKAKITGATTSAGGLGAGGVIIKQG